jgi:hypothetical protein
MSEIKDTGLQLIDSVMEAEMNGEPAVLIPLSAVSDMIKNSQGIKGGTVILAFDRYEEATELETAINGWKYKSAIEEIWQEVFRPRHKHGYKNARLNSLIEDAQTEAVVEEVMDILEELYRGCLSELPNT